MGNQFRLKALLGVFFSLFAASGMNGAVLQISPTNQTIVKGTNAQFTVTSIDGTPLHGFYWNGPKFYSLEQTITVSNAGKYSVTAYDTNNIQFTACATLNVKIPPTVSVSSNFTTLTCSRSQLTLFANTTASNATYNWTGPGLVSNVFAATPTVNAPGTYTVTVTALNGCTASASVTVNEDKAPPSLSVETPDVLTCTVTSVVLKASSPTTNVTFRWTGPGIVFGTNSATCTVNQPGVYTVTATSPTIYAFGLVAHGVITNINGTNVIVDSYNSTNLYDPLLTGIPFDHSNFDPTLFYGPYTNTLYGSDSFDTNGVYGGVSTNILLQPPRVISSNPCPDVPLGAEITENNITNLVDGSSGGITLNGHYSFHYDDVLYYPPLPIGNGCSSTAMVVVQQQTDPLTNSAPQDLNQEFVSFGQSFWSNPQSKINGVLVKDLRKTLLQNPTNSTSLPLVIGKPGRSLTIAADAVTWLNRRLPATGIARPLPDFGDQTLSATTGQTVSRLPMNSNGRFQNRLLGDMIALGFNLRMDTNLYQFALSSTFCTQKALAGSDRLIGTDDDQVDTRGIGRARNAGNGDQQFTIPTVVLNALCEAHLPSTIEGLYEIANRSLAGHATGSANTQDISTAVQTVIAAFNGGRFCVPCQ